MTSSSSAAGQISPQRIFKALHGFQITLAMKAAIELEIFTAIAEGDDTAAKMATRCRAAERGVRILCDFLVIQGFLAKTGSQYALTPESAVFLNRHSPAYMGTMANFLAAPEVMQRWSNFKEIVRAGGQRAETDVAGTDDPMWVEFARSMAPFVRTEAEPLANIVSSTGNVTKVLDIAAGHGLFGIAMAKLNPAAHVYALDWPNVLKVAQENVAKEGLAARHHLLPGDAFKTDFGAGYDVVLLTNFLHHFDSSTNEGLLRKVRAAMVPGGRAAALEFVPEEDRVNPPMAAEFSLTMLGSTAAGDAYTFCELRAMFENAGFREVELHPVPPFFQSAVIGRT